MHSVLEPSPHEPDEPKTREEVPKVELADRLSFLSCVPLPAAHQPQLFPVFRSGALNLYPFLDIPQA